MNQDLVERITYLSNINSGSFHNEGCQKVLFVLDEMIRPLGFQTFVHSGQPVTHLNDDGTKSILNFAPTLHGKIFPQASKRVCLFGHADTVFPVDSSFQKVTRIQDVLYGPGVSDMKGGIVIMLEALKRFLLDNPNPNLGFDILINSDEEIGSVSSADYMLSVCPSLSIALGYEPALPCGNFAGQRKGGITFSILAKGLAAHAGRDFDKGINAVTALSRISVFCDDLWRAYDGLSINVAQFVGGGAVNIVPDTAVLRINMRCFDNDILLKAYSQIKEQLNEISKKYEVEFDLVERNKKSPKVDFDKQLALQQIVTDFCQKNAQPHEFHATGGMCDGNLFSGQQIPTVDTLGAIGGKIHTSDEFMNIDALEDRINLSVHLLSTLNKNHGDLL